MIRAEVDGGEAEEDQSKEQLEAVRVEEMAGWHAEARVGRYAAGREAARDAGGADADKDVLVTHDAKRVLDAMVEKTGSGYTKAVWILCETSRCISPFSCCGVLPRPMIVSSWLAATPTRPHRLALAGLGAPLNVPPASATRSRGSRLAQKQFDRPKSIHSTVDEP